jgi:6-phosphogluconolactonase (cycloisomerase 2 family)
MKAITALVATVSLSLCASAALGQSFEKALFVTNNESGTISSLRVNYDGSLLLVGTYPVGNKPQDCAISPDGRFLVVLNSDPDTVGPEMISVFRVNLNGTLAGPIANATIPDAPLGMGMSRNGFVLAPSTASQSLESLMLGEDSVVPVGNAPAGVFPLRPISSLDSRFIYCAGSISPDDLVTFSMSTGGALARINTLDIPSAAAFGLALHPSGDKLYVSTGQNNTINWYNVNQSTGAIALGGSVNPGGNSVTELAVTPNGQWLYSIHVLSDSVNVVRINANGSLSSTGMQYNITSDARDVVTDGRFVYATDETLLGGSVGIYGFQINQQNGSLTQLGFPTFTGGFRPQFMALWSPPVCPGDSDRNGVVEFRDITEVLSNWGNIGPAGDANYDGAVGFEDITDVLANFGECVYR